MLLFRLRRSIIATCYLLEGWGGGGGVVGLLGCPRFWGERDFPIFVGFIEVVLLVLDGMFCRLVDWIRIMRMKGYLLAVQNFENVVVIVQFSLPNWISKERKGKRKTSVSYNNASLSLYNIKTNNYTCFIITLVWSGNVIVSRLFCRVLVEGSS